MQRNPQNTPSTLDTLPLDYTPPKIGSRTNNLPNREEQIRQHITERRMFGDGRVELFTGDITKDATKRKKDLEGMPYSAYFSPQGIEQYLAESQTGWQLLGRSLSQALLGQIVGGTLANIGYLFDAPAMIRQFQGTEQEWGENFLSAFGNELQRRTREEWTPIYQTERAQAGWAPGDATWWASHFPSITSSLSLLIPTGATMAGLRLAARGLRLGRGMSRGSRMLSETVTSALMSRHMYSTTESRDLFESSMEYAKQELGFDEAQAREYAGNAAAFNYKLGYANLWKDMLAWGAILHGPKYATQGLQTKFNEVAHKAAAGTQTRKLAEIMATGPAWAAKLHANGIKPAALLYHGVLEGFEEYNIQWQKKEGQRQADIMSGQIDEGQWEGFGERMLAHTLDRHTWDSFFWGFAGGMVFGVGGRYMSQLTNKNNIEAQEKRLTQAIQRAEQVNDDLKAAQADIINGDVEGYIASTESLTLRTGIESALEGTLGFQIEMMEGISRLSSEQLQEFGINPEGQELARTRLQQFQEIEAAFNAYANKNYNTQNDIEVAVQFTILDYLQRRSREGITRTRQNLTQALEQHSPFSERMSANGKARAEATYRKNAIEADLNKLNRLIRDIERSDNEIAKAGIPTLREVIKINEQQLKTANELIKNLEGESAVLDPEQIKIDNEYIHTPINPALEKAYNDVARAERNLLQKEDLYREFSKPEVQKKFSKDSELKARFNAALAANEILKQATIHTEHVELFDIYDQATYLERSPDGMKYNEFHGIVELTQENEKGEVSKQQYRPLRFTDKGFLVLKQTDANVSITMQPQGKLSKEGLSWQNYRIVQTGLQARQEAISKAANKVFKDQIGEQQNRITSLNNQLNNLRKFNDYITKKLDSVVKGTTKTARLHLKQKDAKLAELSRRTALQAELTDTVHDKASITVGLHELQKIQKGLNDIARQLESELQNAETEYKEILNFIEQFNPEAYQDGLENLKNIKESTHLALERAINSREALQKYINRLRGFIKGLDTRMNKILQENPEARKAMEDFERFLDEAIKSNQEYAEAEMDALRHDLINKLGDAVLKKLSEQELNAIKKLEAKESELQDLENHIQDVITSINELQKQIQARAETIIKFQREYYKNVISETPSIAGETVGGMIRSTAPETQTESLRSGDVQPWYNNRHVFARTTSNHEYFVAEYKKNNLEHEPKILFQEFMRNYDLALISKDKGYAPLHAMSARLLLEKYGDRLTDDQKSSLESDVAQEGVFTVIVDKRGNPVTVKNIAQDGESIMYSPITKIPFKDGAPQNKRVGSDFALVDNTNVKDETFNKYALEYNEMFESWRNSAEPIELVITGVSPGHYTAQEPVSVVGRVVRNEGDIKNISVNVAKTNSTTIRSTGEVVNTTPGFVYIEHEDRFITTHRETLQAEDISRVQDLLTLAMNREKVGELIEENILYEINKLTYFVNERKGRTDKSPFSFYIASRGKGSDARIEGVVFGNEMVTKEELLNPNENADKIDALRAFLETKWYNVDANTLERANEDFTLYKVENNKLVPDKVYKADEGGYKSYLMSEKNNSPKLKVNIPDLPADRLDALSNPQFINRATRFRVADVEESIRKTAEEAKKDVKKGKTPKEKTTTSTTPAKKGDTSSVVNKFKSPVSTKPKIEPPAKDVAEFHTEPLEGEVTTADVTISSEAHQKLQTLIDGKHSMVWVGEIDNAEGHVLEYSHHEDRSRFEERFEDDPEGPREAYSIVYIDAGHYFTEFKFGQERTVHYDEALYILSNAVTTADITETSQAELQALAKKMGKTVEEVKAFLASRAKPRVRTFDVTQNFEQDLAEFRQIFPDMPVQVLDRNSPEVQNAVARLINTKEYAKVLVAADAPSRSLMHEAFHGVSLLFTTPQERSALYQELRDHFGNREILVETIERINGEEVVSSEYVRANELTDRQAEEFLAEEFREYRMDPIGYRFGQNKIKESLFRRIWNALIDFVLGKDMHKNPTLAMKKFEEIGNSQYLIADRLVKSDIVAPKIRNFTQTESLEHIKTINYDFFQVMHFTEAYQNYENMVNIAAQTYEQLKSTYEIESVVGTPAATAFARKTIENWDSIVEEHLKYMRQFAKNLDIEQIVDTVIAENTTGRSQFIESNRFNQKELAPPEVKLLVAGLPRIDMNGNYIVGANGRPQTVDYARTFGHLSRNLANLDSLQAMMNRLNELANTTNPEFRILMQRLGINEERTLMPNLNADQMRLLAKFYDQMNKSLNGFVSGLISPEGNIYMIDAVSSSAENILMDSWKNNVKLNNTNEINLFKPKGDTAILNPNYVLPFKGNDVAFKDLKESHLPKLLKGNELTFYKEYLKGFGIFVSEANNNEQLLYNAYKWTLHNAQQMIKRGEEVTIDKIFDRDGAKVMKELNALVREEAKHSDLHTDNQVLDAKGNSRHSLALKHKYGQILDNLNSGQPAPHMIPLDPDTGIGNILTYNSVWYDYMQKNPNAVEQTTLLAFGEERGDKTDIQDLKFTDLLSFEFNAVMNGVFPYFASDRATTYAFNFGKDYVGVKENSTPARDMLKKYLEAEIVSVIALRSDTNLGHLVKGKFNHQLSFFKSIMPELNKLLQADEFTNVTPENYATVARELIEGNSEQINTNLERYLDGLNNRTIEALEKYGLIISNKAKTNFTPAGISPEILQKIFKGVPKNLTKIGLDKIAHTFNYYWLQNAIEQIKLVTGDPYTYLKRHNFSEFHKRTSMFTSTKSPSLNDPGFVATMNRNYKRADNLFGHEHSTLLRDFVYADHKVNSIYHSQIQNAIGNLAKAYKGMTENDAQGRSTLDGHRSFGLRNKIWNNEYEKTWQYQTQYLFHELMDRGFLTPKNYIEYFKQHLPENVQESEIQRGNYYFDGQLLDAENLQALPIFKPQSTGPLMNSEVVSLHRQQITKTGLAPMLPTDMSSEMIDYYIDLMANGIDFIFPASAKKGEILGDGEGRLAHLYDKEGKLNRISDLVNQGYMIEQIDWSDFGNQLDIDPAGKTKVTKSTQKRRLTFVDVFNNGESTIADLKPLYDEYTQLERQLVDIGLRDLTKRLGLSETTTGEFELINNQAFKDTLLSEFERRDMPQSVFEAIDIVMNEHNKFFDALPTKRQLTNLLQGLIRSNVIAIKTSGDMLVQEASTMHEKVGDDGVRPNFESSNFLKFYRMEEGVVKPAEAMIPLPKTWIPFIKENIVGRTFEEKLANFNKYIKQENWKHYDNFKKIRNVIANRIPGQHLNSIEALEIMEFTHPTGGSKIVLPSEIVAKTGSDFDIDKLTTYFNNVILGKKTKMPIYLEYKGNETNQNAIENRINEITAEVLLHKDNFSTLIRPNNSELITQQGNKLFTDPITTAFESNTLVEFSYNAEVYYALANATALVGVSAINNVHHATTQATPIKVISPAVKLFFQPFKDNNEGFYIGHKQDQNKHLISDTNAGIITAAVDAGKEAPIPSIFKINLTMATAPTYFMLNKLGNLANSPMGFETITQFMTAPIVRKYEAAARINESQIYENKNLRKEKSVLVRDLLEDEGINIKNNHIFLYERVRDLASAVTDSQRQIALANLSSALQKAEKSELYGYLSSNDFKTKHLATLEYFLYYQEIAKYFNQLALATRPEAKLEKNYEAEIIRKRRIERLKESEIFDNADIDRMMDETFIGAFENAHDKGLKMFEQFYIDRHNPHVKALLWGSDDVRGFIDIYDNPALNKPIEEIVTAMERLKNATINYILHTTEVNGERLNDYYTSRTIGDETYSGLVHGKNNALEIIAQFKGQIQELLKNNSLEQFVPMINEYLARRGENLSTAYLKTNNKRLTPEESNMLTEGLRELMDVPANVPNAESISALFQNLVNISLIQSGVQPSFTSFFEVLPPETYFPITHQKLNQFHENTLKTPFSEQAIDEVYANLRSDRNVVPYQQHLEEVFGESTMKSRLSADNRTLSIFDQSQNAMYDYLAVEIPKVNKKQAEEMRSQGLRVPVDEMLFKKVKHDAAKKKMIYERIPGRGEQFKFFEAYGDISLPSLIPSNNIRVEEVKSLDKPSQKILRYTPDALKPSIKPTIKDGKVNIYFGTGENRHLSNFAKRPFNYNAKKIVGNTEFFAMPEQLGWMDVSSITFNTVEQGFQFYKFLLSQIYPVRTLTPTQHKTQLEIKNELKSDITGARAKALGRKILLSETAIKVWDEFSPQVMKQLLLESFKQNPNALINLLATENAELTHIQDRSKWKTLFPKLLTEVRAELQNTLSKGEQYQLSTQPLAQVDKVIDTKLTNSLNKFFKTLDVNVEAVETIYHNGQPIDAVSKVDVTQLTVEYVEGKRGLNTLPEEAAHIYVRLLPEAHPLKKVMMRQIEGMDIYKAVQNEYSEVYKGDETLLKEEAIAKTIAEHMVEEARNSLSEGDFNTSKNWMRGLINFIKKLFAMDNGFKTAALNILNNDMQDTIKQRLDTLKEESVINTEHTDLRTEYRGELDRTEINELRTGYERTLSEKMRFVENTQEAEQSNRNEVEKVSEAEFAKQEIINNFENYFPLYKELSSTERRIFVDMMANGEIKVIC